MAWYWWILIILVLWATALALMMCILIVGKRADESAVEMFKEYLEDEE